MNGNLSRRHDVQIACTAVFIALLITIALQSGTRKAVTSSSLYSTLNALLRLPGLILFFAWSFVISLGIMALAIWFLLNHSRERSQQYQHKRRGMPSLASLALSFDKTNHHESITVSKPQPFVYPECEAVEKQIQEIISIVIRNHIDAWYSHISERPLFAAVVEHLLRNALIHLKQRLETIDLVGILARKAVPIITQHLHEITVAENHVMDTLKTVGIDALEQSSISEAVASSYKGRVLHPAAQAPEFDESHVLEPEDKLQSYLRGIVARLLPMLVPEHEIASSVVAVFIREILTCAIFEPIFLMLADPDFWNETLVIRANQVIQERARVKRFRHVLKEQTQETSTKNRSSRRKPMKNLEKLMVSADSKDWDRLYRKIKKSQSLVDVTRMRNEMMILKNEMLAASYAADEYGASKLLIKKTTRSDHFVIKAMSLLEARIASLGGTEEQEAPSNFINLSFDRTLALGTSYFFDFLERRNRVALLDFWQRIVQIKLNTTAPIPFSQLSILDSAVHLSKDEIQNIVGDFFHSPLLTITEDEKALVMNYLLNEPDSYDIDSNEVIVNVARRAYKTMELDDFPAFKNDKLYFTMMTGLAQETVEAPPLSRSSSSTSVSRRMLEARIGARTRSSLDLTDLERDYFHNETMGMIDESERDVLEAMEEALHSTLIASEEESPTSAVSDHRFSSTLVNHGDDAALATNGTGIVRLDAPSTMQSTVADVKTAEPGDLNLIEEIDVLDGEIEKRKHSLLYIDKFLNSKRDIDHLDRKIVLKSRVQTNRELNALLAQKQLYEADDHSLFGRSSVTIESSTTHQDVTGGDYVVYVIEVRRLSPDGMQAGWIITRRYSEFNELHAQLKQKFPQIANLDFPKKQLNRLRSVADVRRPVLQSFLQSLLKDEAICKSFLLRNFLSQNNITVNKRQHKSVLESFIGMTDPREAFSRLFALLESPDEPRIDNPDLREVHPAPSEAHDDILSPFAKPIVDLVLEAFDLRERSKWIRKKAVVLILQQLLGGTIESRVRDGVSAALEEHSLVTTLTALKARLARMPEEPGTPVVKTKAERQRVMDLARQTLREYNPSYIPDSASKKIFRALQIRTLNMHLLGRITDSIVDAILVV